MAVTLVVLFHFFPELLPGGYVGVDAFFVISGFLITQHLAKEAETTGTIQLVRFWARRMIRLLPASLGVLFFCVWGTVFWVPPTYWQQYLHEILSATFYVENWRLVADSIDYLASTNSPSPCQHFWSLSVEEQFYAVWPLLVLLAVVRGPRGPRPEARRRIFLSLLGITLLSLGLSVAVTHSHPAFAYFATPVRAWEFAVGGLLATAEARPQGKPWPHTLALLGAAALLLSALLFDEKTAFPGFTALLPVLGTGAALAAGETSGRWGLHRLYAQRPVQWLGDVSYSVYLWHWPLLIFFPQIVGRSPTWSELVIAIVGLLAIAHLSKRLLEDPLRRSAFFSRGPVWRSLTISGVLTLITLSAAWTALPHQQTEDPPVDMTSMLQDPCFGAGAGDPTRRCPTRIDRPLIPDPIHADKDRPAIYDNSCRTSPIRSEINRCDFGDPSSHQRIALVGDSHAAQWFPALEEIVLKRGWSLSVYFKGACPFNGATFDWKGDAKRTSCAAWNRAVQKELLGERRYGFVVTSAVASHTYESPEDAVSGFVDTWRQLSAAGSKVIAIADTPHMDRPQLDCLLRGKASPESCGRSALQAIRKTDFQREAAERLPGVVWVNLNPLLCPGGFCPAVLGSVVIYRDSSSHLTSTAVRSLRRYLERAIPEEL